MPQLRRDYLSSMQNGQPSRAEFLVGQTSLFNVSHEHDLDHVGEVPSMTAAAADWRSSSRSNHGQTILEVTIEPFCKAVTCKFGRDGRIRTGGLLLPN